jgi:hypothetical protein
MEPSDYTDIVARFADELTAETFANFIASVGIPCDVVELWDAVRRDLYAIRVERTRITELRQALDLKPVATRLNFPAAHIIAGRLAREKVPCYVGGGHIPGPFGDFDVPIKETTESGFTGARFMVAVPERLVKTALGILSTPPVSEADLEKLALRTAPEPNDSP